MVHDETPGEEFEQLLLVEQVRGGRQICVSLVGHLATFGGTRYKRRQEAWRDDGLQEFNSLEIFGCLCKTKQRQRSIVILPNDLVNPAVQDKTQRYHAR